MLHVAVAESRQQFRFDFSITMEVGRAKRTQRWSWVDVLFCGHDMIIGLLTKIVKIEAVIDGESASTMNWMRMREGSRM